MKTSAGAPDSICLASALLAAYETTTLSPVRASNCFACSSNASLRLAAAKTVTVAANATGPASASATKKMATAEMTRRIGRSVRIFRIVTGALIEAGRGKYTSVYSALQSAV